ncbi:DUF5654 family protein [Candidatus Nomurabacteria bacterium]|nr:DUF5654 family protein [Candidatus Nomurabacteria bacterium]
MEIILGSEIFSKNSTTGYTLKDLYKTIITNSESLGGKFGYAVLITLIGVIISIILGKIFIRNKKISLSKID